MIGYGYEYISPENFNLPRAVVVNKVLAPEGPAYKAFIIRSGDILTLDGVQKIVQYALQGLPIILYGGLPTAIAAPNGVGLQIAQGLLKGIGYLPNVHQVPSGSIASALASIGIQPLTRISGSVTWFTYWREDEEKSADYVYVFNDGNSSEGSISFASTRTPYLLNAWTGDQKPILQYTVDSGYTTIPLKLAAGQSIIIAFLSVLPTDTPLVHITSAPSTLLGYSYSKSTGLVAKVPMSVAQSTIKTSNGKLYTIPVTTVPAAFTLPNWTLVAESWGPSPNLYDVETTIKTNTTFQLTALTSWQNIAGLEHSGGVGYYSTTFLWSDTSVSAIIDFGQVVQTLRVRINGHQLPPLDFSSAKADISQYLVKGTNTVEAIAATPLFNALIPIWDKLQTSGSGPLLPLFAFGGQFGVEAGLVGTVTVTPYKAVKIF